MNDKKLDFISLQKDYVDTGLISADELKSYNQRSVILTFSMSAEGTLRAPYMNKYAYPRAGSGMTEGMWICTIEFNKRDYTVDPVCRIGAAFLMELKSNQREDIVSYLWEKHRDILEPMMKSEYEKEVMAQIDAIIAEKTSELTDKNRKLEEEISELQRIVFENEFIIRSKDAAIEMLKKSTEEKPVQEEEPKPLEVVVANKMKVYRTGPNEVSSDLFTHARYFAHVSYDLRTLIIRPHEHGTAVCFDDKIILSGLSTISNYDEPYEMDSKYDPVTESITIRL